MRTAVYEDDMVQLYEDGVLVRTVPVMGKSHYWIEEVIDNWENMPV